VHVAYLGGRKLAVKVQRPAVETEFAPDLHLMVAAIRLIRCLGLRRFYWMIEPLSEFIEWTREEMDYRHEARYMERMREVATRLKARVPTVIREYTTRRTLVAEFLDGITVLDYLRALDAGDELIFCRLEALEFDSSRFAANIIDNFLSDAYCHGLFHADLHPANLLILSGNTVGYIDFGITGVLSHYSRHNLVALTLAYTRADLNGISESFIKSSVTSRNARARAFREGLATLADTWYRAEGKERRLLKNFTMVMLDMLKLSRKTGIWPERDVIKYIRSAIAIDGLITRFAPGFNVGRYLERACDHYLELGALQTAFSYESLLGLSMSNGRLLRDGVFRIVKFLERVGSGELTLGCEPTRDVDSEEARRSRVVLLGFVLFVLSLLMVLAREGVRLGANLFTAEAILISATVIMLLRAARRLG
jgi:predicted unusual protein kinase regulating ubiquinone biosynthesis (AarF/ABC1/UbiB family)